MIKREILSIPGLHGSGIDIPYFELVGKTSSPHLTVLAGIHGAEYSSIAAARKFVEQVKEEDLIGRITVVPIVNTLAFWSRVPFVIPVDNENLNRAFPGNPDGSFTDIYAFYVFEKFIKGSDFLLDMHAGDIPEALEPFTIFEESPVEETSLKMAKAFGIQHIVRQRAAGLVVAGSTSAAASNIGIPSIIAESGQNGILDTNSVDIHLQGLINLARSIGVMAGAPWAEREHIIYDGWNWLRAEKTGWWQPAKATGELVKAGEILGTLSDPWGDVFADVLSPQDGRVLFQTSSPAVMENGILLGLAIN